MSNTQVYSLLYHVLGKLRNYLGALERCSVEPRYLPNLGASKVPYRHLRGAVAAGLWRL